MIPPASQSRGSRSGASRAKDKNADGIPVYPHDDAKATRNSVGKQVLSTCDGKWRRKGAGYRWPYPRAE
eukprot:9562448-Lingulodinium_polyedra.AAC.1